MDGEHTGEEEADRSNYTEEETDRSNYTEGTHGSARTLSHAHFLALAYEQATVALAHSEVPVGCVVVQDGRVLVATHNATNRQSDPLCHAEYMAVKWLVREAPSLSGLSFYITIEPCVMCHGVLSRLGGSVYFGCRNPIFGTHRLTGQAAGACLDSPDCVEILRRFYASENAIAPEEKRLRKG